GSPFCTTVHSFPHPNFQIPLAKKNGRVYSLTQIEPGSLKNLAAQLKEGAAVARPLRPQSFVLPLPAVVLNSLSNNLLPLVRQGILSDFGEVSDALFASAPYRGDVVLSRSRNRIRT